jgi:hypothetical protein
VIRLLFIAVLISFSFLGQSQGTRFNAGIRGGVAGTQIAGDGYKGFDKAGVIAGPYVSTQFTDKFGAKLEMLYIQKGSWDPADPEKGKFESYRINLSYIELPVMATYKLGKFNWETGVSFGTLLSSSQEDENGPISEQMAFLEFNDFELAVNLGLTYSLSDRFVVNVRYSRSFLPIANEVIFRPRFGGFFGGSYNTVAQFTINYEFLKSDRAPVDSATY